MTPHPDNLAANCLSTINQTRNIRSVEVNSTVAMIIWVIECMANLNLLLIDLFPVDGLITLNIVIAWYYVIIPLTFLMNTSYNKDRVVENGWKVVLLNPFVKIRPYFKQPTAFELKRILRKGPKNEKENVLIGQNKTIQPSKEANPVVESSPNSKYSDGKNKERVFIISNKKLDNSKIKVDSVLEVEDIEVIPSTSMNKNNIDPQPQLKRLHAKSSSSDSEPANYTKSHRLQIGENILRHMAEKINEENCYLHYFHQLLEFEDMLKNEPLDPKYEFEITPFPNYNNRNVPKVKSSFSQIQQSEKNKKRRKKLHSWIHESVALEPQIPELSVNNNNTFYLEIKSQLRCDTLKKFELYCEDEEKYDIFLKRLIDVEEEIKERFEGQ